VRVLVCGATGRAGRAIAAGLARASAQEGTPIQLVGGVAPHFPHPSLKALGAEYPDIPVFPSVETAVKEVQPEVSVDFTHADAFTSHGPYFIRQGIHQVVGTTGISEDFLRRLGEEAEGRGVALVWAPNFSIGAVLMMKFSQEAAPFFPASEIVEIHHRGKKDAPSGTSFSTARQMERAGRMEEAPPSEEKVAGARGASVGSIRIHSLRLPGFIASQTVFLSSPGEILSISHSVANPEAYLPGVLLALRAVPHTRGLRIGLESLLFPEEG